MPRRTLVLIGATSFSLMALLGLMWFLYSLVPVTYAGPAKIPSGSTKNSVQAWTPPPGCTLAPPTISGHNTWSDPCYIVSDIVIQSNAWLTISPGVWVYFEPEPVPPKSHLMVEQDAGLTAIGTASAPITFTSGVTTGMEGRCDWDGITLVSSIGPPVIIQHAVIEYACTGIRPGERPYLTITHSLFRHNGDGSGGGAIVGDTDQSSISYNEVYDCQSGFVLNEAGANDLSYNEIYDIDGNGIEFTPGLGVSGGSDGTIVSNMIYHCGGDGIRLENSTNNDVFSNTIHHCGGNGIRLEDGDSNTALDNTVYQSRDAGVVVDQQSSALLRGNLVFSNALNVGALAGIVITNGSTDVELSYNQILTNGNGPGGGYQAALYIHGMETPGFSSYLAVNGNVISDVYGIGIYYAAINDDSSTAMQNNAICSIPSFELDNQRSGHTIDARYTWWGNPHPNSPTTGIDPLMDNVSGSVNFTPWITLSPPDGSANGIVTVTLRDEAGYTVPPPPSWQTVPPAINARRIELSTNWGTLSPPAVFVGDQGIATTVLIPGGTPASGPIVITATAFCGYQMTGTVDLPDLVITKTAELTEVVRGGLITHTITYSNTGSDWAGNVRITDALPPGTTYVADTSGLPCVGCIPGGSGPLVWTVGSVAPGAGDSFAFVLQEDNSNPCSTTLTNTVGITTTTLDRDATNNEDYASVHVIGAEVTITKTTALTEVMGGDLLTYTIAYRNAGDAPAGGVEITDTLPPGTSFESDGSGLPCVGCVPGGAGPLVWTVGTLPPDSLIYSFDLVLRVDVTTPSSTTLTNAVSIATTTPECANLPDEAEASPVHVSNAIDLVVIKDDDVGPVTFRAASLTASKRAAVARALWAARGRTPLAPTQHRQFVRPGDLVTYTIALANLGPYTATNVVLTETLPLYTQFVTNSLTTWTAVTSRTFIHVVGTLPPGGGYVAYFVVRVHDPLPSRVTNLINLVCGWDGELDLHPEDNCNYEDTPVRTTYKLYVANRDSGTVDVFDTTTFEYVKTITVGVNPFGMALYGDLLFVADFDAANPSQASLHVVDTLSDTVVASIPVGAHAVHVVAYDGYVYVASHSSPPAITVVRAEKPWDIVAQFTLDRPPTYEFGFFGATADTTRDRVYFTKRDFGSVGIWSLTPHALGSSWLLPEFVFGMDESNREKPGSILYHPTTDRVYVTFGLIDELWVFNPENWTLLERISTGHQDPTDPGFGGHGLAALGLCTFVSNYLEESVTAIIDGSCVHGQRFGPASVPAGVSQVFLPAVGKSFSFSRSFVTVPLEGRPKGMTAAGNLLFVTLPIDGNGRLLNRVAVINTETWERAGVIDVLGNHPHTIVLGGGNYIEPVSLISENLESSKSSTGQTQQVWECESVGVCTGRGLAFADRRFVR